MKAVLVAAGLGALTLWTLGYVRPSGAGHRRDLVNGAAVGAAVQLGVRLAGVS